VRLAICSTGNIFYTQSIYLQHCQHLALALGQRRYKVVESRKLIGIISLERRLRQHMTLYFVGGKAMAFAKMIHPHAACDCEYPGKQPSRGWEFVKKGRDQTGLVMAAINREAMLGHLPTYK
jgi:hypothetical protein